MQCRNTTPVLLLGICLAAQASADEPKLDDLGKALVGQMAAGQFDKVVESFDAPMKRVLPADKLRDVWKNLTAQCGPFVRVTAVKLARVKQYDAAFITCEFQQAKIDAKIVFTALGPPGRQVTGLFFLPAEHYRPAAYIDRGKFEEREIEVGSGLMPLSGTLSLPKGAGPFAAVVLVHGSGPNDRDETIGPNKPFADIAQGLATRGIAVLRYEKRTKQYQTIMALTVATLTVKEETVDDSVAACKTLAAQAKIDHRRVFVLGHSLGGMLLPRIGLGRDDMAGYISLAGSTTPLEDVILKQMQYIFSLEGKLTEQRKAQLKELEQQVARVKSPALSETTSSSTLPLGVSAKYWLDLRGYDPAKEARSLKKPMLFLQGERDYQVTMDDFARWKAALGSRPDVTFKSYPALNHLFAAGQGKSTPAEYSRQVNVAPEVIDDLARWIDRH